MTTIMEQFAATTVAPMQGSTAAVLINTTPTIIDMTTFPPNPAGDPAVKNPIGHYVRITAEVADTYFVTGTNATTLANVNAVSYSTVNATTYALTLSNNEVDYVVQGSYKDIIITQEGASTPKYLALVTLSGNAVARIHQSSP